MINIIHINLPCTDNSNLYKYDFPNHYEGSSTIWFFKNEKLYENDGCEVDKRYSFSGDHQWNKVLFLCAHWCLSIIFCSCLTVGNYINLNGKVIRMIALVITGDVEGKLQHHQEWPEQSSWWSFHFCVTTTKQIGWTVVWLKKFTYPQCPHIMLINIRLVQGSSSGR